MDELPLWQAESNRLAAQRELEEARAKMYAAQKKYSRAHDAYLLAMQRHRDRTGDYSYSTGNTPAGEG